MYKLVPAQGFANTLCIFIVDSEVLNLLICGVH